MVGKSGKQGFVGSCDVASWGSVVANEIVTSTRTVRLRRDNHTFHAISSVKSTLVVQ